jgi:hypothetical protein
MGRSEFVEFWHRCICMHHLLCRSTGRTAWVFAGKRSVIIRPNFGKHHDLSIVHPAQRGFDLGQGECLDDQKSISHVAWHHTRRANLNAGFGPRQRSIPRERSSTQFQSQSAHNQRGSGSVIRSSPLPHGLCFLSLRAAIWLPDHPGINPPSSAICEYSDPRCFGSAGSCVPHWELDIDISGPRIGSPRGTRAISQSNLANYSK